MDSNIIRKCVINFSHYKDLVCREIDPFEEKEISDMIANWRQQKLSKSTKKKLRKQRKKMEKQKERANCDDSLALSLAQKMTVSEERIEIPKKAPQVISKKQNKARQTKKQVRKLTKQLSKLL